MQRTQHRSRCFDHSIVQEYSHVNDEAADAHHANVWSARHPYEGRPRGEREIWGRVLSVLELDLCTLC